MKSLNHNKSTSLQNHRVDGSLTYSTIDLARKKQTYERSNVARVKKQHRRRMLLITTQTSIILSTANKNTDTQSLKCPSQFLLFGSSTPPVPQFCVIHRESWRDSLQRSLTCDLLNTYRCEICLQGTTRDVVEKQIFLLQLSIGCVKVCVF